MSIRRAIFFAFASLAAMAAGCEGTGDVLGMDVVNGPQGRIPPGAIDPGPGAGSGCHSDDPNQICLGVRYVAYVDPNGAPVVTADEAARNVEGINSVWKQCNLSFEIDEFVHVRPQDLGLAYQTSNYAELSAIRQAFASPDKLLIVTTGTWDRKGTLGNSSANAWTSLPGGGPYGVILERPVATYANIIAHELGHYLNLLHLNDVGDVMNPVIYGKSTALYDGQCDTARSAAKYFWTRMIR